MTRRIEHRTNNAYGTILLLEDGIVIGNWTVRARGHELANFNAPGDLADWEPSDEVDSEDAEDYGELVAYRAGTPDTHITDILDVSGLGVATIDGIEYVAYDDGCYRHVVTAEDWGREWHAGSFDGPDGYTEWCNTTSGTDDKTAIAVGKALGLTYVHSTDGGCGRLSCDE